MARGKQFGQLVEALRDEAYMASSPALAKNVESALKRSLARHYERLWDEHPWPHLKLHRDEAVQAGERFYSFDPDLAFEDVERVYFQEAGTEEWREVRYGIGPRELEAYNSDTGERSDPVYAWQAYEDNQYEVWPIPATNGGTLRMYGRRTFVAPVKDTDIVHLDDQMVILFAAAEWLERGKSRDAQLKLQQAMARFNRLKGKQSKQGVFALQANHDRGPDGPNIRVKAPR